MRLNGIVLFTVRHLRFRLAYQAPSPLRSLHNLPRLLPPSWPPPHFPFRSTTN